MSKPSWDEAPEWANWLGLDGYGYVWFEFEPYFCDAIGWWATGGNVTGKRGQYDIGLERRQ